MTCSDVNGMTRTFREICEGQGVEVLAISSAVHGSLTETSLLLPASANLHSSRSGPIGSSRNARVVLAITPGPVSQGGRSGLTGASGSAGGGQAVDCNGG